MKIYQKDDSVSKGHKKAVITTLTYINGIYLRYPLNVQHIITFMFFNTIWIHFHYNTLLTLEM